MKLKLLKILTEEVEEQGYGRYYTDVVLPSGVKIGDTRGYNFLSGNSINKSDKVITKVLSNSEDVYSSTIGTLDTTPLEKALGNIFVVPTHKAGPYGWRGKICNANLKDRNRYDYTHWHAGRDYSGMGRKWVITLKDGVIVEKTNMCFNIEYTDGNKSRFCHMTDVVSNGKKVFAGEIVGKIGDVGSEGHVHLHWEYYPGGGGYVNHVVPPLKNKYTQSKKCINNNVNLSNSKVNYYINQTLVKSISDVMTVGGAATEKENYDKVYIRRTDVDPNGFEKNYIKYINSKITKERYDEALKKSLNILKVSTKDEEIKKEIEKDVKELTDKVTNDTEYSIIKSDIYKGKNVHVLFGGSHTSDYSKIKGYVKYLEPYSSISIIVITHCNNTLENVSKYVKDKFDGVVTSIAGFSQGGKETWKHANNSSLTLVGLIDPSTYETDVTFGSNTYLVCDPNNWGGYKFVEEVKERLKWYCTHKDDQKYSGHVECTKGKSHTFSGILTYFYKQYGYKI
jgi:hypothetical protein